PRRASRTPRRSARRAARPGRRTSGRRAERGNAAADGPSHLRRRLTSVGAPPTVCLLGAAIDPESWQRVKEVFHRALERPRDERATFVADACGDDTALAPDVGSPLHAPHHAGNLL